MSKIFYVTIKPIDELGYMIYHNDDNFISFIKVLKFEISNNNIIRCINHKGFFIVIDEEFKFVYIRNNEELIKFRITEISSKPINTYKDTLKDYIDKYRNIEKEIEKSKELKKKIYYEIKNKYRFGKRRIKNG